MRPWPLLLVAASSDARCGCDRRVIVATTVNGVRTASLLVPSAARVGAAFDAWTARFDGDAAQAGDLVGKNPGLLYCRPAGKDGIENAPLDQAVAIANAMDFFRFGRYRARRRRRA